jgi:hypothetical protein
MDHVVKFNPELMQYYQLYEAEQDYKLPLRLAFIGLLGCCNEDWVFQWRPRHLKVCALPYDDVDFEKVLEALIEREFITKCEVQGKPYGSILPFLYK